jgi:hypothetical protein
MGKFYAFLGVLAAGVVAVLALLTALASASASLANGTANLVSSTALLTGQCMTGFLVLVSLAAGVTFGLGWSALRSKALPQPPVAQPRWVSGPNARWGRIGAQSVQPQLSAPQAQPAAQQVLLVAEVEEVDDDLPLNGWGF